MIIQKSIYKMTHMYLVYLLIMAVIFLSMPFTVFAAFDVSLYANPAQPDSDTQVVLEWDSVAGAQRYEILRNNGGEFVSIETIDPDAVLEPTTFIDIGLTPDTTYTYQVKAYLDTAKQNAIALSYNEAIVRTSEMISPDGLSSMYNINTKNVTLSWETDSAAATGYVVRVGNDSGAIVTTAVYSTNAISFATNETNPVNYVIISNDGAGGHVSDASQPVTVTPLIPPTVTVSAISGFALVSWGTFSPISDFQLERSRWGGTAWSSWELAKSSLSGSSTTDSPVSGGTYRYRLNAKSNGNYAGHSNVSGNVVCPKAPTGLGCSIADGNLIVLVWNIDPTNESILKVGRKTSDNSYSIIATLNKSAQGYGHTIPVVLGTTYTYRVYAYDTENNVVSSEECSVTAEIPAAPSNLTITADSKSQVTLNWQDNSNTEQNFYIERKTDLSYTRIGTVSGNTPTYTDDSIDEDHTYTYRVQAYNTLGLSAFSDTISIAVNNIIVPGALTVTPISSSQLDLAWSYPGNGRYSTVIERKTGTNGAWSVLSTTPAGVYTYSNSGLAANTQYFYRVRNSLGSGITTPSYPDNDTGIGTYTMLGGLSLSGEAASGGRIRLSWSGTSAGSEVAIERKMANGNFSVLATINTSINEWYDTTGLIPGASYTYRVKARNSLNESTYSSELTVENVYLEAPSDLEAGSDSNKALTLSWKDNSDGETGFEIWRRQYNSSSSYILLDKVGRNITKYTDKNAQSGVQYYYRIRAYLSQGELYSAYTVSESAGLDIIDPPDDLEFDYISDTSIKLTWDDNSHDESGFGIERRIGADGDWEQIAAVSKNTESYKYTGLSPNIKYFFRIRAYNGTGSFDSFSEEIEITTGKPKAPSNVSVGSISSFQAKITWKDNSDNETGFKIERAVMGSTNYRTVARVGKDVTSYIDNRLSSETQYSYKVTAYNDSDESESEAFDVITGTYVTFYDVAVGFWARDAIINLAGRGIIKGITNTEFKPGNTITRAEFTALMIRAFKLDTAPIGSFADVKIGKWYYNEVMIAENLGIVNGDSGNRFYPDRMITREEMAVIIVKTLSVTGKPLNAHGNNVLEKFWDRDLISPYAISSIASVVGEGIMTGLPGNALAPKKTLTRAEAAAIIYRIIDL